MGLLTEPEKRPHGELGTLLSVCKGEPPPPPPPPDLQAPIRSVADARRNVAWDEPGGWQEALEEEIERAFVHNGSTQVAPALRRRETTKMHAPGKARALA